MWKRNVAFVGLIFVAGSAVAALVFPSNTPPRPDGFDLSPFTGAGLAEVVGRIDASFHQMWQDEDLRPAPRAPRLQVLRRMSLALVGTVPSLEEIRQFEAYQGERPLQWWLEGLLHDRRFADYFAERLARAYVGTEEGPFLIFRRRRFVAWLSDQLLANRPYGDLVRELITAEGLWTDTPATNFITVTIDPDKDSGPDPERLAARVTRAFLGIRIDCAQCHDHPFQPWTEDNFHGLAAMFGQTHQGLSGIYDGEGEYVHENTTTQVKKLYQPAVPFFPELLPKEGSRRDRLARWITHPKNTYFAQATVNRIWALLLGRPLVEPVDDLASADVPPEALMILAEDFASNGYDLHRLIRVITATEVFHLDSRADHELTSAHEEAWAAFPMTRLRPEQVVGSVLQAASVQTISSQSHIVTRLIRYIRESDFVRRYGDTGEDEFTSGAGTIPQRLLLMNGEVVKEQIRSGLLNASTQIALMASDNRSAIEAAYLAVLTRRPTAEEWEHFDRRLGSSRGGERQRRLEDLYWTLINSTEFSWNH